MKGYKNFIDLFMAKPFNIDDLVKGIAAIDENRRS
jgi:DNA-binding response OmpR family regulator